MSTERPNTGVQKPFTAQGDSEEGKYLRINRVRLKWYNQAEGVEKAR